MADIHDPKLVLVVGPSGAGKTTLIESLERIGDGDVAVIDGEVTRAPRAGDRYRTYVTAAEFHRRSTAGCYFEVAEVYGNWYGTPKSWFYDPNMEEHIYLLEVDIRSGLRSMLLLFPNSFVIGVVPASLGILRARILGRDSSDDGPGIEQRLALAEEEITAVKDLHNTNLAHFVAVNDEVDRATQHARAMDILRLIKEHFHVHA